MADKSSAVAVLIYFKGRGRAELIRLMLEITGTPYKERTISGPLLEELRTKGDLFFQQLPLLEIDGLKLVQSAAIVRYLARKHDMYGSSQKEAYLCDMITDGLSDFKEHFISFTNYKQRQENPAPFNAKVCNKLVPRYMKAMEEQIKTNKMNKASFLLGEKLSYADVALLEVLELLEEAYPGLVKGFYPLVGALHQHLRQLEQVDNYLKSDRRNPPINDDYIAHVRQILP